MIIETFVLTVFQQNTRIVACDETREALCIDPGERCDELVEFIRNNHLDLKAIVLTHGHLDHVGGTADLARAFPTADILIHKDDEDLYYALPQQPLLMGISPGQVKAMGMDYEDPPKVTRNLNDADTLEIGKLRFSVRHCPGHTRGHIVLAEGNEKAVFTGDCLFNGTIGRTDLPGGDYDQLIDSIRAKVLNLDDDYAVYCGHGPDTTVGKERASNPFLNGAYQMSRGRFV